EFRFSEWWGYLVLDYLDASLVTDHFLAVLERADAADIQAHRGIELQRIAAGRGLRVAEHHADLHPDLVDEDHDRVRTLDVAGELAQRLGHQTGMQSDLQLAHLALDLRLRSQGRDRIDRDHVDRSRAHEHVGDLEGLL